MSYCRPSAESDIYAYPTDGAFIIHLGDEMFVSQNLEEFKSKLTELRQQGYKVPQKVFDRIEEEISGITKRAPDRPRRSGSDEDPESVGG